MTAIAAASRFAFVADADVFEAIRGRRRLYVCRTEAGAAALWEAGLAGVTPVGGWNVWLDGHAARLKGADVAVLQPPRRQPDPELLAYLVRRDAESVARSLAAFGCRVHLLDLPGLEPDQGLDAWLSDGCGALAIERLAAATPRFRLTPLPDPEPEDEPLLLAAAEAEAPAVTELVEGLLPDGMLAVLSGKDKNGKTLLAQEIVRAILTGRPLLGRFPVRAGPVVAAFLDDPMSITLGRLATLGVRRHANLYLAEPQRLGDNPFAFLDRLETEGLLFGPVLIVLDALYLLTPTSADAANDAARMTPILRRLDQLATRTRAAVAHRS